MITGVCLVRSPQEVLSVRHAVTRVRFRKLSEAEIREYVRTREPLDKALAFLDAMGHLHTQDEEESVFPRLLAASGEDRAVVTELTTMLESKHREKETGVDELAAKGHALPCAPAPPLPESHA